MTKRGARCLGHGSTWLLGATLALGGCKESPAAGVDPAASAAAATASAAQVAAAPGSAKARMKEFEATPDAKLGTLPEGVGIPVGKPAPKATAQDAKGGEVKLEELIAKGPILLVFYRGGWCPYCSFEIHALVEAFPEYQKRGVLPVAVSVDKVDEAAKTEATFEIPFPVLSDPDLALHEAFRVVHKADQAEAEKLKGFGIDLEKSSGRTHHSFAIPALFLIDKAGVVRWAHADPDYKVRPKNRQILAAIDAAGLSR